MVIDVIFLMLSVSTRPKVITLSGFHCMCLSMNQLDNYSFNRKYQYQSDLKLLMFTYFDNCRFLTIGISPDLIFL
jgi:hypothetical protein